MCSFRYRLRVVAYRMLGSLTEADDAVQDTWLRLSRSGAGEVENLGGWLTTVLARVCLNMLRSRNLRREQSLGMHLPDPLIRPEGALQPEEEALLADSVGLALLVVLDTLGPAERLAFVLHDMFELPFEEIAAASLMIRGAAAVARQAQSGLAAALRVAHLRPAVVNGAAGVVATVRGRPITVVGFTVADGKIADPERVRKIAAAVLTDE